MNEMRNEINNEMVEFVAKCLQAKSLCLRESGLRSSEKCNPNFKSTVLYLVDGEENGWGLNIFSPHEGGTFVMVGAVSVMEGSDRNRTITINFIDTEIVNVVSEGSRAAYAAAFCTVLKMLSLSTQCKK